MKFVCDAVLSILGFLSLCQDIDKPSAYAHGCEGSLFSCRFDLLEGNNSFYKGKMEWVFRVNLSEIVSFQRIRFCIWENH